MTTPTTMSANLQQRLARVSEQFGTTSTSMGASKDSGEVEDDDEDDDDEDLSVNHSGSLKSYSKRKLSCDDKDEDDDDDEDESGLSESKTTVTIQLEQQSANPQVFQSYVDVQDEVTDLRDEDIIEAVPGTTVVMTSSGSTTTSNVDVVAAAVNEAIKDIEYEASEAAAAAAAAAAADNVRVEAQPVDTHANMSPETLTAISGSSSPQPPDGSGNPSAAEAAKNEMMQDLFSTAHGPDKH